MSRPETGAADIQV